MIQYNQANWCYLNDKPQVTADYRAKLNHFQVEEHLGFEPSGSGEHVFLWIEKSGHNTQFVAKQLAKFAAVNPRDVSYSGLKDRHGVTKQWFCVPVPIKSSLDWSEFELAGVTILRQIRHGKKLRTGTHQSNHFTICLSHVSDQPSLFANIERIKQTGVPNYYGPQRFGHEGNNLVKVQQMFSSEQKGRRGKLAGLMLSAARSYLFNHLLSERIRAGFFDSPLDGDAFLLVGSQSFFVETMTADIKTRLEQRDIEVALPLFSCFDKPITQADALAFEIKALADLTILTQGLAKERMSNACRALRLLPQQLNSYKDSEGVWLDFTLPRGAFATSVLRELAVVNDVSESI